MIAEEAAEAKEEDSPALVNAEVNAPPIAGVTRAEAVAFTTSLAKEPKSKLS